MKIVIVGAGKVGEYLFTDLNTEDNDIILIEHNSEILNEMLSRYDIMGIVGNGTSYEVLEEAGVKDADVFISVTTSDEINVLACLFAKKIGAKYTIARVRNPEYSENIDFVKKSLGIDLMINPELVAASEIGRSLKYPSALSVEPFADGKVKLISILVKKESPLNNLMVSHLNRIFSSTILICIVDRDGEIFIPSGNFILKENDKVYFTGTQKYLFNFYKIMGVHSRNVNSVTIIGGGRISYYLISNLLNENIEVKLIEQKRDRAEFFSEKFPDKVKIICADGSNSEVLEEERISDYDACVALTGIDEENIMISIYAKKIGVKKSIAKVSRLSLLNIISPMEDYSVVTPKKLVSDIITRVVRSIKNTEGSNIETLYRLCDKKVEAVEIKVNDGSKAVGIELKNLNMKENILICCIIRNNREIFPTGNDKILVGDRVIVISKTNTIQNLDSILKD